jgi:anhydro-N-acetylmuramic acid kinase
MSGTSVDGIDAALVEIQGEEDELTLNLIEGETFAYPPELREAILAVCGGARLSIAEVAALDDAIAAQFALAANTLKQRSDRAVELIGSHGQTVFHRPPHQVKETGEVALGYSVQLGRGEVIAQLTGIPTVSNFRAADIAAGGQGAPLVPKVDAYLLTHPTQTRCVQNIGGMANVTYLPARKQEAWESQICGWDTGPGNVLLDLAIQQLTNGQQTFDRDGNWAAQGTPCQALVSQWLAQAFFVQPPPKSTGRELFGKAYLEQCWQQARAYDLSKADWLATLTELTVRSIVDNYVQFLPQMPDEVLLCGGGSRNRYLRQRLQDCLGSRSRLLTTDERGISADFKEAIAFAVLAYWRFSGSVTGNLPQVTGAKQPVLLGDIHLPIGASSTDGFKT